MRLKSRTIPIICILISLLACSLAFQNCSPTQLISSSSTGTPPTSFNCDGSPNDYYGTSTTTDFKGFSCEEQRKPRINLQSDRAIVTYPTSDEIVIVKLKLNKALENDLEFTVDLGQPAGRDFMNFERSFTGPNAIVNRTDPLSSLLFIRTTTDIPRRMPLGGLQLSDDEIGGIRSWLLAGAKKN